MDIIDFSLKDFHYLLAVAEYKHFSRAAEACAVSQPALSKQVKQIESLLGFTVFERSKRHVMLTEDGEKLIAQIRTVMDEAEKITLLVKESRKPLSGSYRLGVIASSCPYLLPYFVGSIREKYPYLELIIKESLTDNLIKDLKHGELDMVIAATTFEDDALSHIPLFFEPFVLAYNQHAGYKFKARINISDIDANELLLLEDGHCLKDQTVEICKIQESSNQNTFKATSLETLLQMTAAGVGISVIPKLAIPDYSKFADSLQFANFKKNTEGRTMAMYYRKTSPLVEDIRSISHYIQGCLPPAIKTL